MDESRGIRIRALKKKDARDYVKISYGSAVRRYVSFLEARTVERAEKIIKENSSNFYKIFGIFNKSTLVGVLVTHVYLDALNISYFIGEEYRNQHFAYQAILVLSELVRKSNPNIKKFQFDVRNENIASQKLQEALGSEIISKSRNYTYYELRIER